jgi:hypothetical protein
MRMRLGKGLFSNNLIVALAMCVIGGVIAACIPAQAQNAANQVLSAAEATKLLPASVYFKGQSATTQLRNSSGIKFSDGSYLLAVLVDTSGYSSDVQQKYQAYFITETPIRIEGHNLVAGIYGIGFVDGKFNVLDVGAHEIFAVPAHNDQDMKRPMPLKIVAEGSGYRLYAGRNYIGFAR